MSGMDRNGAAPDCRRTAGLRDRIVAGSVAADDREHATTCASCGPLLARASRFDQELGRAARSLITEELPRDILDPAIDGARGLSGVRGRRPVPGLTALIAVIAILTIGTGVWLAPLSPPPSASPAESVKPTKHPGALFHPVQLILSRIGDLEYRCNDGNGDPLPSGGSGLKTTQAGICRAPADLGYQTLVQVGSGDGRIAALLIEADLHSELGDVPIDLDDVAAHLSMLAQQAIVGTYEGLVVNEEIRGYIPSLQPGDRAASTKDGIAIEIVRIDTTRYIVRIEALSPEASRAR